MWTILAALKFVSIPDRDLGYLKPSIESAEDLWKYVSIPDRDLGYLKRAIGRCEYK